MIRWQRWKWMQKITTIMKIIYYYYGNRTSHYKFINKCPINIYRLIVYKNNNTIDLIWYIL